jgi:pimeloyl-ACP methyl ester carboxylesterase
MAEQLAPDGSPVLIDGVEVITPGLSGVVEVHPPGAPGLRAANAASDVLLNALDTTDVQEQLTVEFHDHAEVYLADETRSRSTSLGEPGISIKVPGPGSSMGQVLLASDEDGVLRWVLPDDIPTDEAVNRGADERTYTIPRSVAEDPSGGQRGLIGAIGKKVLKVLAFRLLDAAAGAAAQLFAKHWEDKAHPHRLRSFDAATYREPAVQPLTREQIAALANGPALLFLHGTMSLSHSGFGRLPAEMVQKLNDAYGGRVFAFDHPTVSVTPTDNAKWLARELQDANLTVDLVAHSRGGLVSRVLAERPEIAGLAPTTLAVRKLIMVGAPNAGTALADRKHLGEFVDTFTNLMELIPDNAVTDVLSIIISVVKQLAIGAFGGLDGIMAMDPRGDYLTRFLNAEDSPPLAGTGTTYLAIASNYEPTADAPLARFARDRLIDAVFKSENDLIVPDKGVFGANGSPRFPIASPLDLPPVDSVDHSSYWTAPPVLDLFTDVLKA